ncbi:MAG: PEP-utilizing enzyme [Gammaproteobacteria bacterium]|nr:PEP-utilizing enzyme [Gammaproteobacteria bacterium]
MKRPDSVILPLNSADASLERVGGKGRSLARLAVTGLPVPPGFLLATDAYKDFVDAHALQKTILEIVAAVTSTETASAETASASIQAMFHAAELSTTIAETITQAYAALGVEDIPVAVRSSATAEDLPELSFAGQQDTYLNVRGKAALLDAVRRCWASLWTARAIGYRQRMGIDQDAVAMGVVVQVMVDADVSGILFTANPASGERSEIVVNASYGLGEAIVGGEVTPDTYVLERDGFQTKTRTIGSKAMMILPADDQGTTTQSVANDKRFESSLSDAQLSELAALSLQVEEVFNNLPQDIEWAVADEVCWLLQARPITNLPPAPPPVVTWDPPYPGARLIRRQVVENMPEPLSPLFDELYLTIGLDQSMDEFITELGVPFDFDAIIDRPMFLTVNGYAYCRANYKFSWRLVRLIPRIIYWYATAIPRLMKNLIPLWRDEKLPAYLGTIDQWKTLDLASARDKHLLTGIRELTSADAVYWFAVSIVMGFAKITDGLLHFFLNSRAVKGDLTSGMFLRGFPSKTLQAQEDLETIARQIRADKLLREAVAARPAGELLEALREQSAGHTIVAKIDAYLDKYGHQIYTLDFVQPTQAEDPLPILMSLKTLVANEGYDTPTRQAAMVEEREALARRTAESLGPISRRLFQKFLKWAQKYGPHREEALFYIGAAWPTLRQLALELGNRLTQAGTLNCADDIFFLQAFELEEVCNAREENRPHMDYRDTVQNRRELREDRKRLHPPGMVPEKSRFKFGPLDLTFFETQKRNKEDSDTLNGFAVSPGKITGTATLILSPADFPQMKPNTILVCPTTTPAWTPLFAQASGLVTDIGGILAHGSIVAREYGIPAVMGTGNVTQRIVTGQRISVDGNTGTVTLL